MIDEKLAIVQKFISDLIVILFIYKVENREQTITTMNKLYFY